ncbi:TM156 protein, partial [Upupa epops]|nr:TM156 protein [Upupa epops]
LDTCSSQNSTFPLCTFNHSCKQPAQQRRANQTILLRASVNHSRFQNVPCLCHSSRGEQSRAEHSECPSNRDVSVDQQRPGSAAQSAKGSLEVKAEDIVYSYKYFHFTTVSSKEEADQNTHYLLEVRINHSIVRGRSADHEYPNNSCLVAMMEEKNDCINVSLRLKSYTEYPTCMTKIVWLTMIPVVLVFTIAAIIYKVVQENEHNYCKHRAAASGSVILRSRSSRHVRRTTSATTAHPFPVVKTSKQQLPRTAQTTNTLPTIPEHE